jgi:lipoprotein-anchoring transpeptidase ErfK/SrfK
VTELFRSYDCSRLSNDRRPSLADLPFTAVAQSGTLAGAPGNPLGARLLELDDNRSRIHGTNAPKTIGTNVAFGCIRLGNDDIVDLYGRLRVGTPVRVN